MENKSVIILLALIVGVAILMSHFGEKSGSAIRLRGFGFFNGFFNPSPADANARLGGTDSQNQAQIQCECPIKNPNENYCASASEPCGDMEYGCSGQGVWEGAWFGCKSISDECTCVSTGEYTLPTGDWRTSECEKNEAGGCVVAACRIYVPSPSEQSPERVQIYPGYCEAT